MLEINQKNNEILEVKSFDNGRKEKTHSCFYKKIILQNELIQLNTITQTPITYKIFDLDAQQYITDESINKTVDVYVNDELVTTEDIVNGEGIIQFESAEAGTFKIRVENVECEVVVNG